MRTFVGIALDEHFADALALAADAIGEASPRWRQARWVPSQNLHVTLKFLGDVPVGSVEDIAQSLDEALRSRRRAELAFDSCCAVPDHTRARMIWALFTDPQGAVAELAGAVEDAVSVYDIPREERSFVPHVTMARAKRQKPVDLSVLESGSSLTRSALGQDRVMSVGEATLYKSTLSRAGATYEILAQMPLEGSR